MCCVTGVVVCRSTENKTFQVSKFFRLFVFVSHCIACSICLVDSVLTVHVCILMFPHVLFVCCCFDFVCVYLNVLTVFVCILVFRRYLFCTLFYVLYLSRQIRRYFDGSGFFLAYDNLGGRFFFHELIPACAFKWRSAHAHKFHFLGQDQYTVAERSLTSCV